MARAISLTAQRLAWGSRARLWERSPAMVRTAVSGPTTVTCCSSIELVPASEAATSRLASRGEPGSRSLKRLPSSDGLARIPGP
jgi:hypothetical protein